MRNSYAHLNGNTPFVLRGEGQEVHVSDISIIVRAVRESNYGMHRFINEYFRQEMAYAGPLGEEPYVPTIAWLKQLEALVNKTSPEAM